MPLPASAGLVLAAALLLACPEGEPSAAAAGVANAERERVEDVPPTTLEGVARHYASDLAREPQRTDWSGGDASKGAALYASHCALCHGADGRGEGLAALALNPKPRDLTEGTFYIDGNANGETGEDVDLARVILEGPGAFGGSRAMQGWDAAFTDDEVRNLVAYIRSLSRAPAGEDGRSGEPPR